MEKLPKFHLYYRFYTYINQGALPADPAVLGLKLLLLWSAVMVS